MKQITQKDLIKLIEEKRENARNAFRRATEKSDRDSLLTNKAYIDAYQDLICYLNGVEIVAENQNLEQVYSGKKVKVYTKKMIIGSLTPFESTGKIGRDNGMFIEIQEENGMHAIIDKDDINRIEIVPETIEPNPGQKMNTAEQNLEVPRVHRCNAPDNATCKADCDNCEYHVAPRLREFEFDNGSKRIIDAKEVKSIEIEESYNTGFNVYVDTILIRKDDPLTMCRATYKDLVEWWKYWKEN